jgi:hypothetical protein
MILRSVSGESQAFCMFDPLGGSITDASALPLAAVQIYALMMVGLLLLAEDQSHEELDWPDYSRCGYGTWDPACGRRELHRCHQRAKLRPQGAYQRYGGRYKG